MKLHKACRTVPVYLLLSVIAACGTAGASAHGPKLYPVPTSSWRPGDPSLLALTFGTLAEGRYRGQWCPWLIGGPGSRRIAIVWPAGFRAQRQPFELLDSHGAVVARGGEDIELGGGLGPADHRICMLGQKAGVRRSHVSMLSSDSELL